MIQAINNSVEKGFVRKSIETIFLWRMIGEVARITVLMFHYGELRRNVDFPHGLSSACVLPAACFLRNSRPLSFQSQHSVIMKMFQITIFVVILYVASSIGRPLNGQPSEFDKKADIQITKFHVDTDIQMR